MTLEKAVNDSNIFYRTHNIAVVHKKPTPIQLVKVDYPKRSKAVIKEAYFRRPSTTDYNGVYHGYYLDFDAKETRNKCSFPLKNFHQHQVTHLKECLLQDGICFALIRFTTLERIFVYPASSLLTDWDHYCNGQKKSIPLTKIISDGYEVYSGLSPRVDYLGGVDQLIAASQQ